MSRTLLIAFTLFLLGVSLPATAALPDSTIAENKNWTWYFQALLARDGSSLRGPRLLFSGVINERHEISMGVEWQSQRAMNIPAGGLCASCIHGDPDDILFGYNVSYGYIVRPFIKQNWFRIVLRGGILLGQSVVRDGFYQVPGSLPTNNDYYSWKTNKTNLTAALLFFPSVDMIVSKWAGISVGPYMVLHPTLPASGVSLSVLFGRIR